MARTRRHFTDEFKREAVRLAEQPDTNVSRIAQDLGLDPSVLRRWVGQMRGGTWEPAPGKPLKSAQQQEIEQLRRELAKVKTERDILKKAVGYFAKDQT
ncbi:transposase [Castellaniella defragrans]|uniref:Transposase n=1 Tax=Castellaniella defragrans TaxID=75697 RepID=A0A7W9TPF6_CASDE|nr:transposase [Castellaniella defragrans]KAB0614682.1 transposase [Castellaniella defragrans]MBB6083548.1 transposase [Castellaniella defragrans]